MPLTKESQIVGRFKDNMPHVERADDHILHENEVDGKAWISNSKTLLATPEVTKYGHVDFDNFEDSEYLETRSFDEHRAYGFEAGDAIHWVDVDIVRQLANEVFDMSYDEMKACAKTNEHDSLHKEGNDCMVQFDIPDTEFRVSLAPVIGPDE